MWKSTNLQHQLTRWGALALVAGGCAAAPRMAPPAQPAAVPPVSLPTQVKADDGRVWLIFVDDLHLDFRATGRLRDLFGTISKARSIFHSLSIVPPAATMARRACSRSRRFAVRRPGRQFLGPG